LQTTALEIRMRLSPALLALVATWFMLSLQSAAWGESKSPDNFPPQTTGKTARSHLLIVGDPGLALLTSAITDRINSLGQRVPATVKLDGAIAGFKAFCGGIGRDHPDIVAAQRRMRRSELNACVRNGITDVIEVPVGFGAVVLVMRPDAQPLHLSARLIYQALAAEVASDKELVTNNFRHWSEIDERLPGYDINFLISNQGFGLRNTFDDVFMLAGCRDFLLIKLIYDADERVRVCRAARTDGRVAALAPTDYLGLPKKLSESPLGTIGVLPYAVAQPLARLGQLQILPVNDVMPSIKTITDDTYDGALTIYYYLKRAHMLDQNGNGVVAGLHAFIAEATGDAAQGPGGYLESLGLLPLPEGERLTTRRAALRLERFTR